MLGAAEDNASDGYFKLPPLLDLPAIQEVQLEPQPALVNPHSPVQSFATSDAGVDDPWLFQGKDLAKQAEIRTWAAFNQDDDVQLKETFMSEATPAAFDALLGSIDNAFEISDHNKFTTVDGRSHLACLLSLALGRSSLLYTWDDGGACFVPQVERLKIQGYSGEVMEGLSQTCRDCGEAVKHLQAFVEKIYTVHASPARTALANAIDKLLLTTQSELGARGGRVTSLLQLQMLVQPVQAILVYFRGLIKRLAKSGSDEQLISILFEEAHSTAYKNDFVRNAVCEVLRMVSRPWTKFVEEWIGLRPEEGLPVTKNGTGRSFVKVENKMWLDDQGFELEEPDYFLDREAMPSFVPDDIAQEIFETGRNLRFLRANHPEHRLARQDYLAACELPKLEWQFDWDAISRVERKAKEYADALSQFLEQNTDEASNDRKPTNRSGEQRTIFQFFGQDESQIAANLLASIQTFDNPIQPEFPRETNLCHIVTEHLFSPATSHPDSDFNPHWSLLPLLSFGPAVAAQARAVNTECSRLLFASHSLRAHLRLQRQYHLLGNGLFCSRLSHALFDPDLDTAQRRQGVALTGGVMGLRLSGRDTWPPASSELRLALMGVLAESYEEHGRSRNRKGELPAEMDISFAVRDLTPEEIEKCVDPSALEALDFLRLSYKPPSALRPVFTPVAMVKYDRVFRLLLRVLRMLYVVDQLFRDVVLYCEDGDGLETRLRFRAEAHHFVTRLAAYLFDTGIGEPWARFESWLDEEEKGVGRQGTSYGGPDRIRERHEQALDEIMDGLLLRRRQRPVMSLVEDVFGCILGFVKVVSGGAGGHDKTEVRRLYSVFRKKVELFITVCRGLSEKAGNSAGVRRGEDESSKDRHGSENSIVRLLLLLDLDGHFTKKRD
jgi:hypothetical protein